MTPLRLAIVLALLLVPPRFALAEYVGRTPPRVSLVEGEVSFWRTGSADWEPAQVNLPLGAGDFLESGVDSRLEVQVGPRAFVRAASETQLAVEAHQGSLLRLSTSRGRIALDLRDLAAGSQIEVETPHGKLAISQAGYYDVTVDAQRASFAARREGRAVILAGGEVLDLFAGMEVTTDASVRFARGDAPPPDDWYFWNVERTDRILASASRAYVSEDVYGGRDLDDHGTWRETDEYGRVWVPANVPPSWAPYTNGRWLWDTDYGWTWVDSAPWGWAPYHYGRWVWLNSYWGWAPGPLVVAPVYYPALVGFYGGGGVGVSVSIGFPFVSWVALGWGEPIYPWWGPSWYRGRPCWNGWGGPTIVNNIYVNDKGGHHGHGGGKPGKGGGRYLPGREGGVHYRNHAVPNAVVAARRDDFGRRSFERVHLDEKTRGRLLPARESMPVQPHESSLRQVRERTRPPRLDTAALQSARRGSGGSERRLPQRAAVDPGQRLESPRRPLTGAERAIERSRDASRALPQRQDTETQRSLEPPRRPMTGAERMRRTQDAYSTSNPGRERSVPRQDLQRRGAGDDVPRRPLPRGDASPSDLEPRMTRPRSRPQEARAAADRPAPSARQLPQRSVEESPQPRRVEQPAVREPAPRPVIRNEGRSWNRSSDSGSEARPSRPMAPSFQMRQRSGGDAGRPSSRPPSGGGGGRQALRNSR